MVRGTIYKRDPRDSWFTHIVRATLIALAIVIFAAPAANAQTATEEEKPRLPASERKKGRGILEKTNDAVIAVKTVSYDVVASAGTPQNATQVVVTGKSMLKGQTATGFDRFQFDGEVDARTAQQKKNVVVSSDGTKYFLIDHSEKVYIATENPQELGVIPQVISIALMIEYTHPKPYKDELAGRVELTGYETIGGVDCYIVSITYRTGGATAEWTVGKEDYLPRRVRRRTSGPEAVQQVTEMTITNLKVDEELADEKFRPAQPEGYGAPQPAETKSGG